MTQVYAGTVVQFGDVPVVHARGGQMRVLATPATVGATQLIMGHVLLQPGRRSRSIFMTTGKRVCLSSGGKAR